MNEENKEEVKEETGELMDEINDMIGDIPEPETGGEAEVEEGGEHVEPEEGAESPEAGKEDEEGVIEEDAGAEEEPAAEEEEAAAVEDAEEVSEEQKRITQLEDEKEALQAQLEKEDEIVEKKPEVEVEPEKDFFEGIDYEEITKTPENFMKFLKDFKENIQTGVQTKVVGDVFRSLPAVVMKQSNYAAGLRSAANEFWDGNEDLKPVRKTVGTVVNQIVADHPDWKLNQIFDEAGKTTRKLLKMPEPEVKKPKDPIKPKGKNPAFAKPKGKSHEKGGRTEKKEGVAEEIDDMLNL